MHALNFEVNIPLSAHSLPAKDVDGLLVTGASQDHFVVFHHLTILTDQGDIKEFLVK